ncbi:hypothetical protein ACFUTV_39090 [Streptomyces sp. NPDC057298]|uniref:hypothetical protein n=1 Tax=Streptomyces sp. NPDC057298 TaxID=3346091 RepID=UPI0036377E7C
MITLDKKPTVDTDDQRLTALAATVYIASAGYDEALRMPNPATTLDDMCDALDDVWAAILPNLPKGFADNGPEIAEAMRAAVADRLWAFTAIEYARAEAAAYNVGYLFDYLADGLKKGADPKAIRTDALAAPKRLRELAEQAGDDE